MIGIDADILLRILIQDDAAQLDQVERQMAKAVAIGERVHICLPVFSETVYVLLRIKKMPKAEICAAMRQVLDAAAFLIEQGDALREALKMWEKGKAGFNDYLIGSINHRLGCTITSTFDKALLAEQPERYQSP